MVTITPSLRKTTYSPVVSTTNFAVNFPLFDNTDLLVFVNDAPRTDYTVSATYVDGVSTNAAVVMNYGVIGSVVIYGMRNPRRTDQFQTGRPLSIADFNYALNRLEIESQEARRDINQNTADIAQEIIDRGNAVAQVQANLDAETSARISADTAETTERRDADAALASLIGQAGPVEVPMFDSRTAVTFAVIKPTINAIRTGGYYAAGDGGHALYKRVNSEPSHIGKVRSLDGAWWELANNIVSPRMFGAKIDGSDSSDAIEGMIDFQKPIVLDGNYIAKRRFYSTKMVSIVGFGRNVSSITWAVDGTGAGIEVTPDSYAEKSTLLDIGLYCAYNLSSAGLVYFNWSGLGLSDYFKSKFYAERVHMEAIDSGFFLKGFNLNFVHCGAIKNCFVQNQQALTGITAASYPAAGCIYFDNDETVYNTTIFEITGNELFGAAYGIYVRDIEGMNIEKNDIQVCWKGIGIHNGYRKINQYRIYANHIGVYDTAIEIYNARQALIFGNEISYRVGRTDAATVHCIALEQVQDGEILGNTVRGNYANTSGSITLNGVRTFSTVSTDPTNYMRITANGFRDLMTGIVLDQYSTNIQHLGNTYNNVMVAPFTNNAGAGVIHAIRAGSGTQTVVSGQSPAMWLSNANSAPLACNRDSDSSIALFCRSSTIVGSVSVTSSATTYNTTSDRRLKSNIRDLSDSGALIDALKPRRYILGGIDQAGFVADEFSTVFALSVVGEKDSIDEDGNPIYQTMQASTSEVMAVVIAELQSLRSRMTALESK